MFGPMTMKNFSQLKHSIEELHSYLQAKAASAVNRALTIRNWLIGFYIVEFEQEGEDRARYGAGVIKKLASELKIKGLTAPELSRCRQFYQCYPQIVGTLTQEFKELLPEKIFGSLTQTLNPELNNTTNSLRLIVPPPKLITHLSYTHLIELIKIDDSLKRTFYELECIKGTWSVRELKRQIQSQYFERAGLSSDPKQLAEHIKQKVFPQSPADIVKNIYALEFLGLKTREVFEESDLETALLDHLQQFIIELGNGFCFEARQKRILIGETYYFIDLLFYHRILKCHVLLELKLGSFQHGDIGQLNTYLNYFKAELSEESDNPPVGILLVAEKDNALVKYATAGMDENLFVQQYLIQLPSVKELQKYIETELKELQ